MANTSVSNLTALRWDIAVLALMASAHPSVCGVHMDEKGWELQT